MTADDCGRSRNRCCRIPEADKLLLYTAMAREEGWGKDIPEKLRNENWNYAIFTADKQHRPGVNQAECLACHKPPQQCQLHLHAEAARRSKVEPQKQSVLQRRRRSLPARTR